MNDESLKEVYLDHGIRKAVKIVLSTIFAMQDDRGTSQQI
jgi:hypothetical protein